MHESLHQSQLLLVAVRVLTEAFAGIQAQSLDQAADVGLVDSTAQVAEVLDDLRPAEPGIEGELAWQVADQLLDLGGLCPAGPSAFGELISLNNGWHAFFPSARSAWREIALCKSFHSMGGILIIK